MIITGERDMKGKAIFPLLILGMILLMAVPGSAIVGFLNVNVNNGQPVMAGDDFTIQVSAYDPIFNVMSLTLERDGSLITRNCMPAHTCIRSWTITEAQAGQYTYMITGENEVGQSHTESVSVNVLGQAEEDTYVFVTGSIIGPEKTNNDREVFIDPSTVRIEGYGQRTADHYADFDVTADTELNVHYSAEGYETDWDVFFFDSRIPQCTSEGCSFTRATDGPGETFTTECEFFSSPEDHYACRLTSSAYDSYIEFDYYPYNSEVQASNVIIAKNKMYRPGCPQVYGLREVSFVNGQSYSGLDLDDYVHDDNTPKSDITWTVSNEDYVTTTIGMSNIISIVANDPGFAGSDMIRFTASDGQCSDSDDLLVNIINSNEEPVVDIYNPQQGDNFTENCGDITFNATVNDPDGSITSIEWYSGNTLLGTGLDISVPASTFSPGQNSVMIYVADNQGGTDSDTVTFNIVSHTDPICFITGPVNDPDPATWYFRAEGQMLNFDGTASPTDTCNSPSFQYFWRDNAQAIVNDQQSFSMDNLSVGQHNITMYVTDGLGGECFDVLLLNITDSNIPPTADINSPAQASFVEDCEQIFFNVTAEDPDGYVNNILWYWEGNMIHSGQSFTRNASYFGIGTHNLSVTVIDDEGTYSVDSVVFDVVDHTNPTLMITQPEYDPDPLLYYQYGEHDMIPFNATAAATDVCVPSSFQYIWRENNANLISDMQSFSADNLSVGLHNITVYATDGFGGEAFDTIMLNITEEPNQLPVIDLIECFNEFGGTVLSEHDPIFCNATADDPDGYINIWQWFVYGILGPVYGEQLDIPYPYLDAGDYNVSLTVFDNESASATDSIMITVIPNQAPWVNITLPADADSYTTMEYCEIGFNATGGDTDGYLVPQWDPAYNWRAVLADGTTVDPITSEQYFFWNTGFPVGLNTFSVHVTDDDGMPASDSIVINVTENIKPVVEISVPATANNYTHIINRSSGWTPLMFDADVTDGDQDDCLNCTLADYTWEWSDDFEGSITSVADTKAFTYNNMEVGIHRLIVQSEDCYGESGMDTILVNVTELPNQNPVVTIWDPADGQPFVDVCDIIDFNATAFDPDGDDISQWIWTYGGADLGYSSYFTIPASDFSIGNNTVYARALDNQTPAGVGIAARSFMVNEHTEPDVTLYAEDVMLATQIMNGSSVNESRPVLFNVTAVPQDTCNADQFTYEWEDYYNNAVTTVSNDQSFTADNLSIGWHMIRVTVQDEYGYTGRDTIWINISDVPNPAPVISDITCYDADTWSATLVEYEPIVCNATVTDPNSNNITTWLWDVEGDGVSPETDDDSYDLPALLGNGTYDVSLTVFDDGDPVQSTTLVEQINVTNNAPQVMLTSTPAVLVSDEPLAVDFNCSIIAGTGNPDYDYNMSYGGDFGSQYLSGISNTWVNFNNDYDHQGDFNATCFVVDMDGDMGSASLIVNITDTVPEANFTWTPLNPVESDTVQFNDTSTAFDLPFTGWWWDFENDGTIDSNEQNPQHQFMAGGTYAVNLTVRDADGTTDDVVQYITVNETCPADLAITASQNPAVEGTNVSFAGFATGVDQPLNYSWNFGDGTGVWPGQVVGHVFDQDNNYTVTMGVSDNDGCTRFLSYEINISDTYPTAVAGSDRTVDECTNVFFNGSASTAYDLPFNSWLWDFGDGIGTSSLEQATYSYGSVSQSTTYTVNLTVEDADGSPDSDTLQVTVEDTEPDAFFTYSPLNPEEGTSISFNATGSTENPCDSSASGINYTWNFGDGTVVSGYGMDTQTHSYDEDIPYNVNLTLTDEDGSTDSYVLTINVGDVDPVIVSLNYGPAPVNEGDTVSFSIGASDILEDQITDYEWDFDGDGVVDISGLDETNPSFTYEENSTYVVNVTVYDEDSSVSDTLTVDVGNLPPTANAGGPYACNPTGTISLAGSASDPAGLINDPLTYEWDIDYDSIPANFNQDYAGSSTLITCPVAEGIYTVGFRVSDDDGGVTITETTLNVSAAYANSPPFFNPPLGFVTAINNTPFSYDLSLVTFDSNGDGISWYTDTALFDLAVNAATGMLTVLPTAVGTYNVNITACDDSIYLNNCTSDILVLDVIAACVDADGDGYNASGGACGVVDCDDSNPNINPGEIDICNGLDDDCNSGTVDGSGETAPLNSNQQGECTGSAQLCTGAGGWIDYYLNIPTYEPLNEVSCDTLDNDCDGTADEGLTTTYYEDGDSDFYGNPAVLVDECSQPAGYVTDNTDCDDADPNINPGEIDVCNGVDDDCDAGTADGSGESAPLNSNQQGECSGSEQICAGVSGWQDDYSGIPTYESPDEVTCDTLDNDCDGTADEGLTTTYYLDGDSDLYGNPAVFVDECSQPAGYVADNTDCDDGDAGINPGAAEICGDGIDQDCSGSDVPCTCGDSTVDIGETCDDGNTISGDGCDSSCQTEFCGDGTTQTFIGEQCDDGNNAGGDGCSAICTIEGWPVPTCGDGNIDSGEQCDSGVGAHSCSDFDSFTGGTLTCSDCMFNTTQCTGAGIVNGTCGDNIINPGETCDGLDWGPVTGCADFGYTGGTLSCSNWCDFNTTLCTVSGTTACSDGADNDGDGYTDLNDAGCYNALGVYNASDDDETNNGATQCSNGADDDGDSLIDWPQDPQCTGVL
ncbi:PKD domain-containing protein, partial [Candidatus Woesearchaeota archaeon]|nr:PKD domain-containing protein [Candidatus Woesearchaeota archaeon]